MQTPEELYGDIAEIEKALGLTNQNRLILQNLVSNLAAAPCSQLR